MTNSERKKIMHVMFDEKFNDMAIRQFEDAKPGISEYWVTSSKFVYTKSPLARSCRQRDLQDQLCRPEVVGVIFHSLPPSRYKLLKDIQKSKRVIWLGWGYDYYDTLLSNYFSDGLLLPSTKTLMRKMQNKPLARMIASRVKDIIQLRIIREFGLQKVLSRVDLFVPVLDVEKQLACQFNSWFKPDYLPWNYGTVEDDFSIEYTKETLLGPDILVGNSATYENNHLEIFDYLEMNFDLRGRTIYAPLSYGDERYRDQIIAVAKKRFGSQFVPLTSFMAKDAYIELLLRCGYVFMNHLRQQALGNICMMMLMGAKVYMNVSSVLYQWLSARGATIQSIAPTIGNGSGTFSKRQLITLADAERIQNRQIIKAWLGRDVQRQKTLDLLDYAIGVTGGN